MVKLDQCFSPASRVTSGRFSGRHGREDETEGPAGRHRARPSGSGYTGTLRGGRGKEDGKVEQQETDCEIVSGGWEVREEEGGQEGQEHGSARHCGQVQADLPVQAWSGGGVSGDVAAATGRRQVSGRRGRLGSTMERPKEKRAGEICGRVAGELECWQARYELRRLGRSQWTE
eukprot:768384-Hanusia_phi.AAC.5